MARNKANQRNIDKYDLANYPDARIRNNTGSNDGTPISESVYGDIHETFAKFMREAGLNYNNLPDNVSNGYQLFEAIKRVAAKNDFIGSATKQGNDTVYFDAPLNIFKDKESMIFNVILILLMHYIKLFVQRLTFRKHELFRVLLNLVKKSD